MIWGKSYDDLEKMGEWHTWFAWRPVRMRNKRYVWLQYVLRNIFYGSKMTIREYKEL